MQMDDLSTQTIIHEVTAETTLSNTGDTSNANYDTGDTSNANYDTGDNFSSDPNFTTPIRPRPETIEPYTGKGKLLAGASLLGQTMNYTKIGDILRDAMKGTYWTYTNTGIIKLSPRINLEGKNIYYVPEVWEIKDMTDIQRENLDTKTNPDGVPTYRILLSNDDTFYAEGTLKGKYGTKIIDQIKKVLNMPEEDEYDVVGQIARMSTRIDKTKGMSEEAQIKEGHDIFKEYLEGGFEYPPSRRETPNIDRIINDGSPQTPKQVIDKLIDVPEEELKASGFTDHALRELRCLIKAADSISSVKAFKDIMLKEIDNELKELHEQFLSEDDPDKKVKIGERIVDKENHRKEEVRKIQQLFTEQESHWQRIKRLVRDAFMNDSQTPLKERLKRLYKVEGLTIAFVIAAVTMLFSTIGLAISNSLRGSGRGGGGGSGGGGGGGDKPSIPDRVKEMLKKFAEWLKYLAGKSAAALPGIIGSIVSFLLKTIGQVVGFAAEHVMIFLVLVVSSIIYGLVEGVKEIKAVFTLKSFSKRFP